MDLSQTISELNEEFKTNTGILLPITKFILSNTLILSLLLVIPFKIYFWVYQIGYLSTFGINYDLILRDSIEAQGLWGEVFSSFSDIAIYPFWFFFAICILLALSGIFRSAYKFYRRLDLFRKAKKKEITNKKRKLTKFVKILRVFIRISDRDNRKVFDLAGKSYFLSVIFFLFLVGFILSSIYVYEKGQEQARKKFEMFHKESQCSDGWGQTGCYVIEQADKSYKGYLVTTTDKNIYLVTLDTLLVIPKSSETVIKRQVSLSFNSKEEEKIEE